MKKTFKILSIMLIAIMLVMSVSSIAKAGTPEALISQLQTSTSISNTSGVISIGQNVIGIVNVVAVVVAVVILLVLGIKYMMGSASEKAEYKKSMIPYIIGAFIIFAAPTLVNIIVSLSGNFR